MTVAIGADHGGFDMKEQLVALLAQAGHHAIDVGNKGI
jgi:ribose 5-phosphate isomerase RpiB